MSEPSHPSARSAAVIIHQHFAAHMRSARHDGHELLAYEPDTAAIASIVDAAFWASLRREESFLPTISLAYLPVEHAEHPLTFARPLPLEAAALSRLAPAVKRPGIHLGVWRAGDGLAVWGATRAIPTMCFVLEVVGPGLLVIKQRRTTDATKFMNLAVLDGDRLKVLDPNSDAPADCPALATALMGFDGHGPNTVNALVELAVSMRAHGRGGALLVAPSGHAGWLESAVHPIAYFMTPPFMALANLMREDAEHRQAPEWSERFHRAVDGVAGLTAVDGATVINDHFDLLAFGVKIGRRTGYPRVEQVIVTEPVQGDTPSVVHPSELGGTRHLSAAQFVHDQQDAVAYVASQDGRFTIFAYSASDRSVHARRVEALLL